MPRPTRAQLEEARGLLLPDVVSQGLDVLFTGINPGLYTAWVGHHFARPGNRFWPALHRSGFTPRLLRPDEQRELLALGLGLTNVAPRATARADELGAEELREGGRRLRTMVGELGPRWLAVCGVTAYRTAFEAPRAVIGEQPLVVGDTRVWVLPNPSGLNAHYSVHALAEEFGRLRAAVGPRRAAGR
jgi:TDG/mug DNA glycosylase family protein